MLVLPYPISTNRYWRSFRGRMVRSKLALEYKEEVETRALEAGVGLFEGCVAVTMLLCPALPKDWAKRQKKDVQWVLGLRRIERNLLRVIEVDALQGIAYENDRQITQLSIALGPPREGGALVVLVKADENWKGQ